VRGRSDCPFVQQTETGAFLVGGLGGHVGTAHHNNIGLKGSDPSTDRFRRIAQLDGEVGLVGLHLKVVLHRDSRFVVVAAGAAWSSRTTTATVVLFPLTRTASPIARTRPSCLRSVDETGVNAS
jgi:hypothetical protein